MTIITLDTLTTPDGTTALAVAPWSPDELYAVAADWAQASSPVYSYGAQGWDQTGRQVADYRHSAQRALAAILREAVEAGGDDSDEAPIAGWVADAVEIA